MTTMLNCPFCDGAMEAFGPNLHNHPANNCWLAHVSIKAIEYAAWNRRAAPQASDNTLEVTWNAALNMAAFYVNDHCESGEFHAEAILGMKRPAVVAQASAPDEAVAKLGGAIKMAVNMLSRDNTPVRIEAAGAILAAFGEVMTNAALAPLPPQLVERDAGRYVIWRDFCLDDARSVPDAMRNAKTAEAFDAAVDGIAAKTKEGKDD